MTLGISFTPLAEWLTLVVGGLKEVMRVRMGDAVKGPLIALLWNRLSRLTRRFDALVARLEAGQPAATYRKRTRPARAPPDPGVLRLPRDHWWLFRLLPREAAAAHRGRLEVLLADPQTAALLAAAPEAGRILRPLCRLLAIHPEGALALPAGKPPPRPRFVKPPPPPPPQSAMAQMCAAIAARTPGAMTVTTNFGEPPEKPPWWSIAR